MERNGGGIGPADYHDEISVVATPSHGNSLKLLAFWERRAADGIVMGRDVPSRAIAPLLSHVAVWEPLEDFGDMRIRLAGAALVRRFTGDLKGRLISELFPQPLFEERIRESRSVIESGVPLILDSSVKCGKIERLHAEIVLLPIRSPDRKRGWLLSGASYFD